MTGSPYDKLRAAVKRFTGRTSSAGAAGMMRVTIADHSPAGAKGFDRLFDGLNATLDDMPAILAGALPTIREAHRSVFTTEGAAGRGSWPALAPSTLRDRARLGYGPGPILERSGQLKAHVLSTPATITRKGNTVELRIRPADSVGGVPKYVANALGTSRIPARPMVAIGPAGATKVTSAIMRGLRARAAREGIR